MSGPQSRGGITPELVQKVADKVYALLQKELRRERERRPNRSSNQRKR